MMADTKTSNPSKPALIRPGGTGRSALARWLDGGFEERGMGDEAILAALAPANRMLLDYGGNNAGSR